MQQEEQEPTYGGHTLQMLADSCVWGGGSGKWSALLFLNSTTTLISPRT